MRDRVCFFAIACVATFACCIPLARAQTPQTRIPQQIVINGQNASGAYVTSAEGRIQSFTCSSPQQYATADGSSQGWACYEQTTGVWLLHSAPPAQAQPAAVPVAVPSPVPVPPAQVATQSQPAVVCQPAPPTVVYQSMPPAIVIQQPAVIYSQPATVIVQQPAPVVVYSSAPRPVVMAPAYPSSVIIGTAAINAAARVASAAIVSSGHPREYVVYNSAIYDRDRGHGRR